LSIYLLTRATDGSVNRAPGFISATLRRLACRPPLIA
jgi:hypothetical protein